MTRISVAARQSPLSQAQTHEVLEEIRKFYPLISFDTHFVSTHGDQDKKTSLRSLDKTDFFTREVDALIFNGLCRIAIHSAKDLPDPLPEGLEVIALTTGKDPSDALVLQNGRGLGDFLTIATSSDRREEAVRKICPKASFVDIRGTIQERLDKISNGDVDGVVIAEAAIIRLGLTHLYRIQLPGTTTPLQGQLAIVALKSDSEMKELFSLIDCRQYA